MTKKLLILLIFFSVNTWVYGQNLFLKKQHYFDFSTGLGLSWLKNQIFNTIENSNTFKFTPLDFNYEYAVLNEIGIGINLKNNIYFKNEKLSALNTRCLLFNLNLHYVSSENFDFFIGTAYGIAKHHTIKNNQSSYQKGLGLGYEIFAKARYKWNKNYLFNTKITFQSEQQHINYLIENSQAYSFTSNNNNYLFFKSLNLFFGLSYTLKK